MNFLIILFMINWWCLASSEAAGEMCDPLPVISRNPTSGITKHLGSPFEFRCRSTCNGSYSFFHHNHTSKEFDLISQSSNNLYNIQALDFHDGGEYCCSEQCDDKNTVSNYQQCCIRLKISPVVQWDLPKAVGLHGAPINGSCNVTAYPRPHVIVITPYGCDSQQESIHIGKHTNKVVFTINNATKSCEEIHCFISTFGKLNSTELLIIENVVCESKRRQTKSVNMLTALERGDSMITSQRLNIVDEHDTKDDHDDASYTAGNSSLMVTCNKLITPIALLLVALFI